MTWRTSEELLERVRRQARQHGRSLNDWVTTVLHAATDPSSAGSERQAVRERLSRAGLLDVPAGDAPSRPDPVRLAKARAAAGRGAGLAVGVSQGRR